MSATLIKEKLEQAAVLAKQAKAIMTNKDAPDEEKVKVMRLIEDAKSLKIEAMALKELTELGVDEVLAEIEKKQRGEGAVPVIPSGEFKTWGGYLYEVWRAGHPNVKTPPHPKLVFFKDEEPKGQESKDMSGQTGAGGGFLIPADFNATLMSVAATASIVRQRATVIPMRRRQVDIPVLDQTSTTAGQPHWFGGLHFYWAEEASAKTESDATFRQISLVAHKLIGYTRASDELLDDSAIGLEAFFSGPLGFAGGVAWMEDYAFLRGTGAGQPLGILNAGATLIEGRLAANQINIDDIADMMMDFLPSGRGIWSITQSAMSQMIQLNGPAGGTATYWWQPTGRDGVPGMLMGFPVIWTEKLPRLGQQGDILLADFNYYLIGDRQATTVESTKFDRWQYDQTSWRVVHRVDGQPWLSTPLTLQDGTTQVSPFVILGAAVGS